MAEIENLCLGCMSEKQGEGPCEKCGYSEDTPYLPSYLAPGTLLNDRYITGKLLSYNGEGALYIAFDKVNSTKVTIKEYMPDALCSRKKGDPTIHVESSQLPLYKTYMSEFVELNKTLMKARGMTHIQTALDIFPQNNTAYVVFEYVGGITLKEYLANCSGELTWDKVKELFPPILTTLSLVHSSGIVHRGISPTTIMVTDKEELKLVDFQISAGRTTNTEIACELYPGYSAPEQYSSNEWHGTWTDVYGISAVLYRVLTGCPPTEALARMGTDNCAEPMVINRNVPSHVSKVLMNGLKLSTANRIQTITELVIKLFEEPKFNTAEREPVRVATTPKTEAKKPVKTAESENAKAKKKKKEQQNKIMMLAGIIICLLTIIGFGIAIAIHANNEDPGSLVDSNYYSKPETTEEISSLPESSEESSVEETSATESSVDEIIYLCPEFTGRLFTSVQNNARYSYLKITAEYKFDDSVANGLIISQSIKKDTEVKEGTELKLIVSKGPSTVPLPSFKDKTKDEYVAMLSKLNIKYEIAEEKSADVPAGYVIKCSKDVGTKVNVEKSEVVTITVSKGSTETAAPAESTPADGTPADGTPADNTAPAETPAPEAN